MTLQGLRSCGAFDLVAASRWRTQRLLILCYHGVSRSDEHLWRPTLYIEPRVLAERFEILRRGKYNVIPLGPALQQLQAGGLPPRSVAITFDDGGYDFYEQAYPLLKRFELPATVYQTTYYSHHQRPVFNLICSYLLWKRRDRVLEKASDLGLAGTMDLRSEQSRFKIVRQLVLDADAVNLSGSQKDDMARRLAGMLDLDYDTLLGERKFFLMNRAELQLMAAAGVDIQLHTHRHRTPLDEQLFRKEIRDNRESLAGLVEPAVHFCYPSGIYREEFLPWLDAAGVVSATTCDAGLVTRDANALLLPRLVDSSGRSAVEFESWLSGIGALLAFRKKSSRIVPAAAGRVSQPAEYSRP
jgi:peptidoglycan/xylan/chitin deacetylase (PgdA/CDA1 family)